MIIPEKGTKDNAAGNQNLHYVLLRRTADGRDPVSDRGSGADEAGRGDGKGADQGETEAAGGAQEEGVRRRASDAAGRQGLRCTDTEYARDAGRDGT